MLSEYAVRWIRYYTDQVYDNGKFSDSIEALNSFLTLSTSQNDFGYEIEKMAKTVDLEKANGIKTFSDMEIFMKALYHVLHDGSNPEYTDEDRFAVYLRYVFQKFPHPGVELATADPANYPHNYQNHYLIVYQFRNSKTHDSTLADDNNVTMNRIITSTLVCYLDLCYTYRNALNQKMAALNRSKLVDKQAMAADILARYKDQESHGFTYMDFKWAFADGNKGYRVNDIISLNKKHLRFLGDAGCGKTTILQRIEYLLAKKLLEGKTNCLPVYIQLNELSEVGKPLLKAVSEKLKVTADEANELIINNELYLLLDGYNEILDPSIQRSFANELDKLDEYNKLNIILTDRALARNRFKVFENAESMYPFEITNEDRLQYFKKCCDDAEVISIIEKQIQDNPLALAFLNKPILLSHYLSVVKETKQIPANLTVSYLSMLLKREESEKKESHIEELKIYLAALAHSFNGSFSELQALSLLKTVVDKGLIMMKDSQEMLPLAINMRLLYAEDETLRFYNDDYQFYFLRLAERKGISSLLSNKEQTDEQ